MWGAVLVAVVASAGNNIGKVLQKRATDSLPRLSLDNKVLKAYLRNALWLTGLVVDLLGAVLMLQAVANAPVSVVQPVSGCGMAVMAVFSHTYLKEPMTPTDWLGVTLAAAGTLGVGFCAEGPPDTTNDATARQQQQQQQQQLQVQGQQGTQQLSPVLLQQQQQQQQQHQQEELLKQQQQQLLQAQGSQPQISPSGLVVFLLALLLLLLSSEAWLSSRTRTRARRHNPRDSLQASGRPDVADEVVAGCQAGCCFGLSAATVKTGFLLSAAAAAAATASHGQALLVASGAAAGTGAAVVASGAVGAAGGGGANAAVNAAASAAAKAAAGTALGGSLLLRGGALWGIAGVGAGISLSSAGFFCQTRGFKEGRAVVVSTCAAVTSILTAVIGGMVALGERLPETGGLRFLLFCSWLLILTGICLLVGEKTIPPGLRSASSRSSLGSKRLSVAPRYGPSSLSPPSTIRKHEP